MSTQAVPSSDMPLTTGGQQRLDAQGNVDMNMPVRAVNRSDKPITWLYAREPHVLMPGIPTYIPYMAMVHWQGDPRAVDMPGGRLHEQFRRQHREHLRALYGVYENDDRWAQIPLVECYPIDSDVRFETVLLDPDGRSVSTEAASANETEFLRNQLASMQSQMAHMAAQIATRENATAAQAAALMGPEDLDHQVTTSRSVAPEHSMVGAAPERRPAAKTLVKRPAEGEGPAVTKDA